MELNSELKASINRQKTTSIKLSNIHDKRLKSIDLTLHGKITIITGDSGVGKSLILSRLKALQQSTIDISNNEILAKLIIATTSSDYELLLDKINSRRGCIFLLDEGDKFGVFKRSTLRNAIEQDYENVYLIMCRDTNSMDKTYGSALGTTPANIATLQIKDGTASLFYKYNIGGM